MEFQNVTQSIKDWFAVSGIRILIIIVLSFIALQITRVLSKRLFANISKTKPGLEGEKRARTLSSLVRYILTITIIIVGGIMILGQLGIEIGPVLAAAGVIGVAVGFGAQRLVQDVIAGFFILIDDQIRTGDVVQIAGKAGLVEKVSIRMTTLRDLAGHVHYIRNSQIDVVTNMTKEFSCYVFDIGVAYREDVDEVIRTIEEVGQDLLQDEEFKDDILEPVEIFGLDQFANSSIIIKARIKTKPIKQWRVGREFNRRLKKVFDDRNIEIPFPHMTVYMGEDKQGQAPPVRVSVEGESSSGQ
jgi:small conductance mechanosensitive channel